MTGWSVNLTQGGFDQEITLPVSALFQTSEGPVIELVFWSILWSQWCHLVSRRCPQTLPEGHVQMDLTDLAKLRMA